MVDHVCGGYPISVFRVHNTGTALLQYLIICFHWDHDVNLEMKF